MEELDETSEEVTEKCISKVNKINILIKLTMYRHIFWGKYKAKKAEKQLSCSKNFNSSMMPPSQKLLQQKIKRVYLITWHCISSRRAYPSNVNAEDFG